MTVAELIEELSRLPQDAMVLIRASHWGMDSDVYEIMEAWDDNGRVFLEEAEQPSPPPTTGEKP